MRFRLVFTALAAACVRAPGTGEARIAAAALRRQAPESVVQLTRSPALDRITKRLPLLDGVARYNGTGRGTTIYVFDGGIAAAHSELAGRVRPGFDAFPVAARVCNAHGTAVAGAAAGATLGVAPAAEIVDVKIINCYVGHGSVDAILQAARWTVDDHRLHADHPALANWSFVVDTMHTVPQIDSAIAILENAGILVIASAGNFDIDACRISPANAHRALIVGASALRRDGEGSWHDVRAANTAWGTCIDVYAPGDSVPLPTMEGEKSSMLYWTGTSMAAGYASGAAALLLEAHPFLAPKALARAIEMTATPDVVDENTTASGNARKRLLYIGSSPSRGTLAALDERPRWHAAGR